MLSILKHHRPSAVVALAAILASAGASVVSAQCTLYEHRRYDGEAYLLESGEGVSSLPGRWNDAVSSVRVSAGCELTVHQHRKFAGDRRVFTGDTSDIGGLWNDQISSASCSCLGSAHRACEMYQHLDFEGRTFVAEADVPYPSLGEGWNDVVSSVRVPRGCRLAIYQDYDFRGAARTISPGSYRSVGDSWNDEISSVQCLCRR